MQTNSMSSNKETYMTTVSYRPTQYYYRPVGYNYNPSGNQNGNTAAPRVFIYIFIGFIFIVFVIILWCAGCFSRRRNQCHRSSITAATSVTTSTTSTNNTTTTSTTSSSSNVVIVEIDVKRVGSSIPAVFVYSEKTMEKLECVICLGEFKDGQKGRRLPKCNHEFHLTCIDKWLNSHSTCPICRANTASCSSEPPV